MTLQNFIDISAAIGLLCGGCAAALWLFGQVWRAIQG